MKICLVQPNTSYQITKHRYAFALTFPQMVANLGLRECDYEVYVGGKTLEPYECFLKTNRITHVFITSITSTFPQAVCYAKKAKELGCVTALGGIFASSVSRTIADNFTCFDYICVGRASENFLDLLNTGETLARPAIFKSKAQDNMTAPLGEIMTNNKFTAVYDKKGPVCYELTQGCLFNCSFCTLRNAFGVGIRKRNRCAVEHDLVKLRHWESLKLIDDDIFQSLDILSDFSCRSFKQVIAEARIDHISESFLSIAQQFGVTHLITGIEAFDGQFLNESRKTGSTHWEKTINFVLNACEKYDIVLRPVIMMNYPGFTINHARGILRSVKGWTPENHIELLMSFYTPHPGLKLYNGELLTNDLQYFDHLNMVYKPDSIRYEEMPDLIEVYNEIVSLTESEDYNPPIKEITHFLDEYQCFFKTTPM